LQARPACKTLQNFPQEWQSKASISFLLSGQTVLEEGKFAADLAASTAPKSDLVSHLFNNIINLIIKNILTE
jgi:hypothetical protein